MSRVSALTAAGRGLRLRCPACGAGRLFRAYLKLNAACPTCGADFSHAETADVAPYLTVFVIGLIFTPLTLVLTMKLGWDSPWALVALLTGAVLLALVLLPRVKGMLAALLWRAQREM